MSGLKNDLLLKALQGTPVPRPPVWMMRQAGRFLPDYIKLRDKYSFFERCQTPELATEITVMPVDQVGVDAAIIFSDILVVPQAMGMEVQLIEKLGPLLPQPIKTAADLDRIVIPDVNDRLHYVMDALRLTKQTLAGRVPLIGFAGAPWTLLCYMVQGKGSKTFDEAKAFCYQQPAVAHELLNRITETTILYLKAQIEAGADVVQIFDSWGGLLSPKDFEEFSLQYIRRIVAALQGLAPVIVFAKGAWFALEEMAATGAQGLGLDWCIKPELARQFAGPAVTLQGNFDPAQLMRPIPEITKSVHEMIRAFGPQRYIANLGHGILPNIPVDHAKAFIEAVKSYTA
ncbi:uroporphyrinogen decarboxylase [Chitinophaga sp. SYP-B3965]|uniref:uroporphyrinogen decarboxylase n=1 Tax=Chitinophaga sp. SYP-B3965 TaxID=2663120 RepID=UPI001299F674|nr:uroporphyrinogen decarboxylase [Chitinophaga sp. SYP-B3965]MRG45924.1 uroporphyrinogen decarboxylase [Chitinophaga sp. SYP-B3965]